jgi:hypothetical protein
MSILDPISSSRGKPFFNLISVLSPIVGFLYLIFATSHMKGSYFIPKELILGSLVFFSSVGIGLICFFIAMARAEKWFPLTILGFLLNLGLILSFLL